MKKAVLVMPDAARLRGALRAIRHIQGAAMALVLPVDAPQLAAVIGLAQVLEWAREAGKDVTLIGGSPALRAEAVALGWRVSTSLEEWERWLAETHPSAVDEPGWHIFRAGALTPQPAPTRAGPDLRSPGSTPNATDLLTNAERHEEAIIALIWQTGKLTEVPAAFYAN